MPDRDRYVNISPIHRGRVSDSLVYEINKRNVDYIQYDNSHLRTTYIIYHDTFMKVYKIYQWGTAIYKSTNKSYILDSLENIIEEWCNDDGLISDTSRNKIYYSGEPYVHIVCRLGDKICARSYWIKSIRNNSSKDIIIKQLHRNLFYFLQDEEKWHVVYGVMLY